MLHIRNIGKTLEFRQKSQRFSYNHGVHTTALLDNRNNFVVDGVLIPLNGLERMY